MRRGLFIVAVVAALVVVHAAYALLSQHGVKTSGLYEQLPAAETDGTTQYFAWTQNSRSHGNGPRRNWWRSFGRIWRS